MSEASRIGNQARLLESFASDTPVRTLAIPGTTLAMSWIG